MVGVGTAIATRVGNGTWVGGGVGVLFKMDGNPTREQPTMNNVSPISQLIADTRDFISLLLDYRYSILETFASVAKFHFFRLRKIPATFDLQRCVIATVYPLERAIERIGCVVVRYLGVCILA